MKRKFVLKSTTFSAVVFLLLTGCGRRNPEGGYQQGPAEVPFATVQSGHAVVSSEYTAAIEGVSNIEIRPQVSGYLSKIFVDEGDHVKAGQPLFKIEDRVYQQQLTHAKASLAAAEANLTNVKIDRDRNDELVKSKIVSDLQLQQSEASYSAAEAAVAQARSAVESAKINADFAIMRAPVDGYIGRFNYRLGSLLSPSNQLPITIVSDTHAVYAYFSLSENDFINFQRQHAGSTMADKLKNTPAVSLLMSDGGAYGLKGQIDAVEGQFNKSTGSITLRARFDNPQAELRSGNTGKIVMQRDLEKIALLPIASTVNFQDKIFVFTVDKESRVVQKPVVVSGKTGDQYIVVDGITVGEKYIAQGFERLQAGMPVTEQKQVDHKK